jgi:hypothetical protein
MRYLPVILLTALALSQIYLARTVSLSPWAGGGFGMFSTPDAPRNRAVRAYVLTPGVRREVKIPDHLSDAALRAGAMPTDARLTALARGIAEIPTPEAVTPKAVVIEVWRAAYEPLSLAPSPRIVKSLEVLID